MGVARNWAGAKRAWSRVVSAGLSCDGRADAGSIPTSPVPELFAIGNKEPTQRVPINLAAIALLGACPQICLGDPDGGQFSNRFAVDKECRDCPDKLGLTLVVEGFEHQMLTPFGEENRIGPGWIGRAGFCGRIFSKIIGFWMGRYIG